MRFWDFVRDRAADHREPGHDRLLALLEADSVMVVWWGTPVELVSAL